MVECSVLNAVCNEHVHHECKYSSKQQTTTATTNNRHYCHLSHAATLAIGMSVQIKNQTAHFMTILSNWYQIYQVHTIVLIFSMASPRNIEISGKRQKREKIVHFLPVSQIVCGHKIQNSTYEHEQTY